MNATSHALTQPADWGGLVLVVLGLLALTGTYMIARAYQKNGTFQAALDTVKLVESQLSILETRVTELTAENTKLRNALEVLGQQVSQAAPVRTLIDLVEAYAKNQERGFEDMQVSLSRIEERLHDDTAAR